MTDAAVLAGVRRVAAGAVAAVEAVRGRLDAENVYPVPDGDTGTNLARTLAAVSDALATTPPIPAAALADLVKRSALGGAHGSSGVILSQVIRGFCDALQDVAAIDGPALAAAFRGASEAADRAVRQPVEGTMLTVARSMADAAGTAADAGAAAVLEAVIGDGAIAVARTRDRLEALREAGVPDAGAVGLLEIVRGAVAGHRTADRPVLRLVPPEPPENIGKPP